MTGVLRGIVDRLILSGLAVTSFNTRQGDVTLTSTDVTNALGDANIAYTDVANSFTVAPQTITADADGHKCLTLKRHSSSATANQFETQDESGNAGFFIDPSSNVTLQTYGTTVASSPTLNLTARGSSTSTRTATIQVVNGTPVVGAPAYQFNLGFISDGNYLQFYHDDIGFAGSQLFSGGTAVMTPQSSVITFATRPLVLTNLQSFTRNFGEILNFANNDTDAQGHVAIFSWSSNGSVKHAKPLVVQAQSYAGGTSGDCSVAFWLQDSTSNAQETALITSAWADSTHATWKGRLTLNALDYNGSREGLRIESDGTQALFGAFGHAAVAQQSGDIATGLTNLGWFSSASTYDMLTNLTNTPNALTNPSAAALTANTWNVITASSACNAKLPAPTAGLVIGVRVENASTKLFTLNPNGSEHIQPGSNTSAQITSHGRHRSGRSECSNR